MLHVPFEVQLPAAVVSMAVKDATGTFMNIAENRGRGKIGGLMDVLNDAAVLGVNLSGIGSVLVVGFNWRTYATLAAMFATSYFGTIIWTREGQKISAAP